MCSRVGASEVAGNQPGVGPGLGLAGNRRPEKRIAQWGCKSRIEAGTQANPGDRWGGDEPGTVVEVSLNAMDTHKRQVLPLKRAETTLGN